VKTVDKVALGFVGLLVAVEVGALVATVIMESGH
jgi:hypothetical protein